MSTKLTTAVIEWMEEKLTRADSSSDVKTKCDSAGKYIRTPWALCEEIVGQIAAQGSLSGKKILVVDTVEFIPVLLTFGAEKCNITYVAPYAYKGASIAGVIGVRVVQQSLLEWKPDMKFDVVVGNPPYQLTNSKKLWPEFTQKSLSATVSNGFTALVIPSSWLTSNGSAFKKVRETILNHHNLKRISRDANHHFDVGQDILYFVSSNNTYTGSTEYVKDSGVEIINLRNGIPQTKHEAFVSGILSKVIESPHQRIPFVFNDSLSSSEVVREQTPTHQYRCYYSTANIGYISKPLDLHGSLKIGVNFSSSYYSEKAVDKNMPITTDSVGGLMVFYPVGSEAEGILIRQYLCSKLFRFFVANFKKKNTGFSDAVKRRMLPLLETKQWEDSEIYAHFGLTQEEIDYIEDTIK